MRCPIAEPFPTETEMATRRAEIQRSWSAGERERRIRGLSLKQVQDAFRRTADAEPVGLPLPSPVAFETEPEPELPAVEPEPVVTTEAAAEPLPMPDGPLPLLSDDEQQFLSLLLQEMTLKQIAMVLTISPRTCDRIRERVQEKFQVRSLVGIARAATIAELTVKGGAQ